MQLQKTPLGEGVTNPRNITDEYLEAAEGYEAQIIAESAGYNIILGENLRSADQTQKVIHAVACDGQLLVSDLPQ